jgi:hypothetical protein
MKSRLLAAAVLLSAAGAGCTNMFGETRTGPSNVTPEMLGGSWASIATETKLPATCTKFVWNVTSVTEQTATGSFTATCKGDVQIAGTATGTLSDKTLTWSATATALAPADPDCEVALSGSGTFEGFQMRIPFTGTTCAGEVNGAEILRKP